MSGRFSVQIYVEIPAVLLKVTFFDVSQFLHPALEKSQIRPRELPSISHIIQFFLLVPPSASRILITDSVVKQIWALYHVQQKNGHVTAVTWLA